jgi:hypothetical protein
MATQTMTTGFSELRKARGILKDWASHAGRSVVARIDIQLWTGPSLH